MLRRAFVTGGLLAAQPTSPFRFAPRAPFPGSPILFTLANGPAAGTWMGRPLAFGLDPVLKRWVALAAVGLQTKPGPQILDLGEGRTHSIPISPHVYRTGQVTVPPQFVQPPKAVLKRIELEQGIKKKVFGTRSARMWSGAFAAPTLTPQSSPFGTKRTYNGQTKSVHQGLDFRAPVGTAVHASNRGRVMIAVEMYFEGGFVVLDHGEGLFSLYMHLSAFGVKEGDVVEKGQAMAESGSSGRVTGPHLHFGVQWQGLYMEPGTLLALVPLY